MERSINGSTTKHESERTGRKADIWHYFNKWVNTYPGITICLRHSLGVLPRDGKYAVNINMQAQGNLYWVSRIIKVRYMTSRN